MKNLLLACAIVLTTFTAMAQNAVTAATSPRSESANRTATANPTVHLGDTIVLHLKSYDDFVKAVGTKPIMLFIDGIDSGIVPAGKDSKNKLFVFALTRTAENKELWRKLLRDPVTEPQRRIRLSVGPEKGEPLPSDAVVTLDKFAGGSEAILFAFLLLAIVVFLFYYGSTTDMLRNGPPLNGERQAFSLGRWQMAWWFFWIVTAYIIIWLVTGDRDTVTTSLLVLMGISAATALGSIVIDTTAPARDAARRENLQQEKAALATTMTELKTESTTSATQAMAAADQRVQQINHTIEATTKPAMSKDWLTDVLTDDNGIIALHRFQILVWTIVLGVVFVFTALRDLTMPEFNTTMLALMGISAGTYLGFKFPGPAA